MPSLVVAADLQPMIGTALTDQLRTEGYEVRVAPGTGHVVHNDDFETFLTTVDEWI